MKDTQEPVILLVNGANCFYLRLPGYLPAVVEALKALIPYENRAPKDGLGWIADSLAWAFSYDDYADVLDLLQQLLPHVPAREVDEFPPFDRSKPYDL